MNFISKWRAWRCKTGDHYWIRGALVLGSNISLTCLECNAVRRFPKPPYPGHRQKSITVCTQTQQCSASCVNSSVI